ncbi:hypothetical protein chiPu_0000639 [Chiloscyllium punctatum]|uniref:Receptor ligand binding region domain-containing protein n=1 Tax=Chiloscyllium punctatum TaxID=137246 RepID=A0A401RVR4_CHIPU|nr:hypothetical protein [Chiloscyllium punctatum]
MAALLSISLVFFFSQLLSLINCTAVSKLFLGLQAPRNISFPFSAMRLGSAMQLAIEKVNSDPLFMLNYTLDFVYADSDCDPKTSINAFISQVQKYNISVLFGPACQEAAEITGLFASQWNIPIFGFVDQPPALDHFLVDDTYLKLLSPLQIISDALTKTLQFFGWKYVALIGGTTSDSTWDKIDELWEIVVKTLEINFTITAQAKYNTGNSTLHRAHLKQIATVARRSIMSEAQQLGITSGEYVFFILQLYEVSSYAAYLHDAVILYAMGVHKMLKAGKNPFDGRALIKNLKGFSKGRFYDNIIVIAVIVVVFVAFVVSAVIVFLTTQKYKSLNKDQDMWWKINYEDITILKDHKVQDWQHVTSFAVIKH